MRRTYTRVALALIALGLMVTVPATRSPHANSLARAAGARQTETGCGYFQFVPPMEQDIPAAGGNFTVFIDTGPGAGDCVWFARTSDSWISPDGSNKQGDQDLFFTVTPNMGILRVGEIKILTPNDIGGGEDLQATVRVVQYSHCFLQLDPAGAYFTVQGGAGGFDVGVPTDCTFQFHPYVVDGLGWIHIINTSDWIATTDTSRSRTSYSVDANAGPDPRIGCIDTGSGYFCIAQDGVNSCPAGSVSFSPPSKTVDGAAPGPDLSFTVSIPGDCKWTSVSTVGWIEVKKGEGTGPGDVRFEVVGSNPGAPRAGGIVVGGQTFWVYQTSLCTIESVCHVFPHACDSAGAQFSAVNLSRSFRDTILAHSPRGQRYTRLYYQFSREAVRILLSDPTLLLASRDMLTRYKPVLESMVKGDAVSLTPGDIDDVDEFLSRFAERGSPALKEALGGLRKDLRDPSVLREFNISIREGPKRESRALTLPFGPRAPGCLWVFAGMLGLILGGIRGKPISRRMPNRSRIRRRQALRLAAELVRRVRRSGPVLLAAVLIIWLAAPLSAYRLSNRASASTTGASVSFLTYLGGSADDQGTALATDSAGNTYVAGLTSSPNFPVAAAFQSKQGGGQSDAFVTKLSPAGKIVYSTYLGGSGQDNATAIAVDPAGNAYVAGFTSSADFPVKNAAQASLKGAVNAFVAKLDPAGSLVYSTYMGGSVADIASGIAIDSSGNAYIAGVTESPDFPISGAAQASLGGSSNAFIAKLSADGSRLVYSTYLGGRDTDGASGVSVDSAGQAYIVGVTSSRNFPVVNPLQQQHGGGFFDAFVAKLSAAGDRFLYCTYLGGSGEDRGLRIATDAAGNAYIAGDTDSADFPTASAFQKANNGSSDAFIAKLNPAGSALIYSTYLGGSKLDGATGIAVDSSGFAYVTGFTASSDFPTTAPTQQSHGGGAFDAFVAVLTPTGAGLIYSSYLGGSGLDSGFAIAPNVQGGLSVMGQTSSTDLPVVNASQGAYGGDPADVFVGTIKTGPVISAAQVSGKRLLVSGIGFDSGAVVLLNGDEQKTANDNTNPGNSLIARKAGKRIRSGQTVTLQVRDSDGSASPQFSFTGP